MDIKPVYLFYGEETFLLQKDLAYFRNYFNGEDYGTEVFDGAKDSLDIILAAAEANPLFSEKRLIIVENAPWFKKKDSNGGSKGKTKEINGDHQLLFDYLEHPNEDACLVFTADKADTRMKIVKAVAACGKVREYKPLGRWELPDYIRKHLARLGKQIDSRALDLLQILCGEQLGALVNEAEKAAIYVGERKRIEENDILRVVSRSAEVNSFQLSDALGERNPQKVYRMATELVEGMKPGEYMALFGYITNYIRILIRIKELSGKGKTPDAIAKATKIHIFRVKKAMPAVENYTMEELIYGLSLMMEADYKMKSGAGEFRQLFPHALMTLTAHHQ